MVSIFRTRSLPIILGAAALIVALGGCSWFSRAKPKAPETPAAETTQAPAPPAPPQAQPKPAPPAPPVAPPPAPPKPVPPAPPVAPPPAPPAPSAPPAPQPAPRKPPAGRIADQEMLRSLVQGKTTQAEVRELFGVPQEVIMNPAGEAFIYYRDRTSGFFSRSTERIESLTVRFDPKGILRDYEYRYSGK